LRSAKRRISGAIAGHAVDVTDSVAGIVSHATAWGADGVVCSAFELGHVRGAAPSLYTVVPGIRPAGASANDQARVMTPQQARAAGASAIVMGRPITEAHKEGLDPRQVVESVLKDLSVASLSA
jgi:orotidine-5'-phosphate decarboxylase